MTTKHYSKDYLQEQKVKQMQSSFVIINQTLALVSFVYRYSRTHKLGVAPTGPLMQHISCCINAIPLPEMAAILCTLYQDIFSGFLSSLQQEMLQIYYFYFFDVIIKISTINCYIKFMIVVNYVKAISSDIGSTGDKIRSQ